MNTPNPEATREDKADVDNPAKVIREKVWDPAIRIAHWSLALSVFYMLFYKIDFPGHDWAGYIVLIIISFRLIWGLTGSLHARFSSFIFSPKETFDYTLAALKFGHAKEYASHNPMGALMVFAFFIWIPITILLGVMLFATQQMSGPLEGFIPVDWDLTLEQLHFLSADILLWLIVIHVMGVFWASWWHRENYILAMITGYKNKFRRRSKRTTAADRKNS